MKKITIIFGGSFNPPTVAHQAILTLLQQHFGPTPIDVIPALLTPHKDPTTLAPFTDRMAMCHLMCADLPNTSVSDFSLIVNSGQTIDLLDKYRALHPDTHIILVMGADSFVSLPQWHRWHEVIGQHALFVLARPEQTQDIFNTPPALAYAATRVTQPAALLQQNGWYVEEKFYHPISATAVRAGDNRFIAPVIKKYIEQKNLYKAQ